MADNKKYKGKQDRIRVDSKDPSEVEFLHSRYPHKTLRSIKMAIKKAGPLRKDIIEYLKK